MKRETPPTHRLLRGRRAYAAGQGAENLAAATLTAEGWRILAQRCRTEAGDACFKKSNKGVSRF